MLQVQYHASDCFGVQKDEEKMGMGLKGEEEYCQKHEWI